jgi:uncharacterized protein YcfJ
MNTLFKLFAALAVFFATNAFAHGGTPPSTVSCGDFRSTNCSDPWAQAYDHDGRPLGLRNGDVRNGLPGAGFVRARTVVEERPVRRAVRRSSDCKSTVGRIIGGIIGGVIGHQIGDGRGQDVATGLGAVTGAEIGEKLGCEEVVVAENRDRRTQQEPTKDSRGNTCYIMNNPQERRIVADFHDASKNDEGIVVTSGEECAKAKSRFYENRGR